MSSRFRLIYLWVEEYKNIKNKELSFTLDYKIIKNELDKLLRVEPTHFKELSVKGINPLKELDCFTALIGENGAGKSNLIELISYIFTTGNFPKRNEFVEENNSNKSFCIVEETTEDNVQYLLVSTDNDYFVSSYSSEKTNVIIETGGRIRNFGQTILYHPLNDLAAGTSSHVIFNSTKIASNPFKKLTSGISDSRLAKVFSENADDLSKLKKFSYLANNEYSRLVLLFSEFKYKISSDIAFEEEFERYKSSTIFIRTRDVFLTELKSGNIRTDHFLLLYLFLISVSAVNNHIKKINTPYTFGLLLACGVLFERFDSFEHLGTEIIEDIDNRGWTSLFKELKSHIEDVELHLKGFSHQYNEINGHHLSVALSDIKENSALDFICSQDWFDFSNTNRRSFRGAGIPLKVDGLSSGEISAIHFLSKLKSELRENNTSLVILDEPENSFHPEWQRCLVSILDDMYNDLGISPQTIISSHSPFILSDILDGKALLLGKKKTLKNNFAANINEMLANSFFLESTIGQAAIGKIKQTVDLINNPEEEFTGAALSERIEMARVVINQVGDKVLQKELKRKIAKLELSLSPISKELAELLAYSESNPNLLHEIRELTQKYTVTGATDV
jgi:predicted ATPase